MFWNWTSISKYSIKWDFWMFIRREENLSLTLFHQRLNSHASQKMPNATLQTPLKFCLSDEEVFALIFPHNTSMLLQSYFWFHVSFWTSFAALSRIACSILPIFQVFKLKFCDGRLYALRYFSLFAFDFSSVCLCIECLQLKKIKTHTHK